METANSEQQLLNDQLNYELNTLNDRVQEALSKVLVRADNGPPVAVVSHRV